MTDNPVLPQFIQAIARHRHRLNSAASDVSTRHRINWVDTATVTWTVADSSVNDEVLVSATGGYTLPAAVPLGTLGYVQSPTSDQTPITTETDVTGMTLTVNVGDGSRLIRVRAFFPYIIIVSGASNATGSLYEGSTKIQQAILVLGASPFAGHMVCERVYQPASGSRTFKARMAGTGTGVAIHADGATYYPTFTVEDAGAA